MCEFGVNVRLFQTKDLSSYPLQNTFNTNWFNVANELPSFFFSRGQVFAVMDGPNGHSMESQSHFLFSPLFCHLIYSLLCGSPQLRLNQPSTVHLSYCLLSFVFCLLFLLWIASTQAQPASNRPLVFRPLDFGAASSGASRQGN